MKRFVLGFLFSVLCCATFAQGSRTYVSLPAKKWGVALGNAKNYTGLRLNFKDWETVKLNGINVQLWSKPHSFFYDLDSVRYQNARNNGLQIGIIQSSTVETNGISWGTFLNSDRRARGLSMALGFNTGGRERYGVSYGTFTLRASRIAGVGLSGCYISGDTLSGLLVSGVSITGTAIKHIQQVNGVAIAVAQSEAYEVNGVMIGGLWAAAVKLEGVMIGGYNKTASTFGVQIGLFNSSNQLHGMQFGLLNRARNVPRWRRVFPIVNWNFRRERNITPSPL